MPRIDFKTTCPFCHGKVEEIMPVSFRFCTGDCVSGTVWHTDGKEILHRKHIPIACLLVSLEKGFKE